MSQYPYGISDELSEEDQARLESTVVSLGDDITRTAADLVVGWAAHVNRLDAEHRLRPAPQDDVWTAHDYIAALIIRTFTERALDQLGEDLRPRVRRVVARFDARLRSFTAPDEGGLVRRFAAETGDHAGPEWWWERIPLSGPVRDDLDRFAA